LPKRPGHPVDPEREKSKAAVRKVLDENYDKVVNEQMTSTEVASELIERNEPCWHRNGWKDPTAINLINREMINFRKLQ